MNDPRIHAEIAYRREPRPLDGLDLVLLSMLLVALVAACVDGTPFEPQIIIYECHEVAREVGDSVLHKYECFPVDTIRDTTKADR